MKSGIKPDIIAQAIELAFEKCDGNAHAALHLLQRRFHTAARKRADSGGHSIEYIKSRVSYCPSTGEFRWLSGRPDRIGEIAGNRNGKYAMIKIGPKNYNAHRLAWVIMTGEWPSCFVDHINGQPRDNRWENLRSATQSQNMANAKSIVKNSGLPRGVGDRGKGRLRYRASLKMNGKYIMLGAYETSEEAGEAYAKAAKLYFGEFAYSNRRVA